MTVHTNSHTWSTGVLPKHERFAYWREAVLGVLTPLALEDRSGGDFSGKLVAYPLDLLTIAHGECPAHFINRTRANIAHSSAEFAYLVCPQKNGLIARQFGRRADVKSANCVLLTSDEPFAMEFLQEVNSLTVQIPLELLASRFPRFRDACGFDLAAGAKFGEALAAYVGSLSANRLRDSTSQHAALTQTLLNLLELSLREFLSDSCNMSTRSSRIGKEDLVAFIDIHLADPLLSPRRAALALGLSERSVHLIMKHAETSFMAFVRSRRLDRIADILRRSSGKDLRISEIAFDWGFNDLSTFHRAFRERFDAAPKDFLEHRSPVPGQEQKLIG